MMKHDRGQYRIELTVGKRQGFDDAILEDNLGTSLVGFLTRPGKHLRRRVNSIDSASGADTSLGGNGKCAGTAAYVQDRLAGFQARQVERLFAVRMLSAK
jgi:hypothetical protein